MSRCATISLTSGLVVVFFGFILPTATLQAAALASPTTGSVREFDNVNGHQIDTSSSLAVGHGVDWIEQSSAVNEDRRNDGPNGGGPQSFQSDGDHVDQPIDIGELPQDSAGRHEGFYDNNEELPRQNHTRPEAKEYDDEDEEEDGGGEGEAVENVKEVRTTDYGEYDDGRYNIVDHQVTVNKPRKKITSTKPGSTNSSTKKRARKVKQKRKATIQAVRDKKRAKTATSMSGRRSKTSNGKQLQASLYPIIAPGLSTEDILVAKTIRPAYGGEYRLVQVSDDSGNASPSLVEVPNEYQLQQPEVKHQSDVQIVSSDRQRDFLYQYASDNTDNVFRTSPVDMVELDVNQPELGTNAQSGTWLVANGDDELQAAADYAYSQPNYYSSSGDQTAPGSITYLRVYPDQHEQSSIRLGAQQNSLDEGNTGSQLMTLSHNTASTDDGNYLHDDNDWWVVK